LDHVSIERSSFPKTVIVSHLIRNHSLFGMCHVYVMLEQLGQRNVVIIAINELWGLLQGLLDDSMSNLGVENEITKDIELVGEG
jgi:hypothetical protein